MTNTNLVEILALKEAHRNETLTCSAGEACFDASGVAHVTPEVAAIFTAIPDQYAINDGTVLPVVPEATTEVLRQAFILDEPVEVEPEIVEPETLQENEPEAPEDNEDAEPSPFASPDDLIEAPELTDAPDFASVTPPHAPDETETDKEPEAPKRAASKPRSARKGKAKRR